MSQNLTKNDLDAKYRDKVYTQSYEPKRIIDGVKLIQLKNFLADEGDFGEVMRFTNGELEGIPGFKIAQINRTRLSHGSVKAWHLHFKQDEIWYVLPSSQLLVGLWDVREKSSTKSTTMRLVLGGGQSTLLFIPKGVAHGSANLSGKDVEMFYFVDNKFDPKAPDENRIPYDALGKEFWMPERD